MSYESAELTKISINLFLASTITSSNVLTKVCEKVGASWDDITPALKLDKRIGKKFLHAGPGFGGSCFPKDSLALVKTANDNNCSVTIVEETIKYNNFRKINMVAKIQDAVGEIKNKKISILGLSFKPETDDMRESPSIDIIHQ